MFDVLRTAYPFKVFESIVFWIPVQVIHLGHTMESGEAERDGDESVKEIILSADMQRDVSTCTRFGRVGYAFARAHASKG